MMKKTCLLLGLTVWVLGVYGQGIQFREDLNWKAIKEKARKEHKFIFIDCYATWCGPCKMMDKNVYTSEILGEFMDSNYVSLKLQMDRTPKDSRETISWYTFADSIKARHTIPAYPTFLFLSAAGDLMYRSSGYKPVENFLDDALTAIQTNQTLGQSLKEFYSNTLPYSAMEKLALATLSTDNRALAEEIAGKVKRDTLDALSVKEIITHDHITFIREFPNLVHTSDNFFKAFSYNKAEVDSIVHKKGFSNDFQDYIIKNDFISPQLWKEDQSIIDRPNWQHLQSELDKKFGQDAAKRTLLDIQIRWYTEKNSWQEAIKYNVEKLDLYGLDTSNSIAMAGTNNLLYNIIFLHSKDSVILDKSIKWMRQLLKVVPDQYYWMDTYANLLYKNGRVKEAIEEEEKAITLINKIGTKAKNYNLDLQQLNIILTKMKEGKPTWQ